MSSTDYGHLTARHYHAWRPPLHACILATGLAGGKRFQSGLDVGCGTGHSTHALAKYCSRVTGIDPDGEMIARAEPSDCVIFATGQTLATIEPTLVFDLVSFAGSLHYADLKKVTVQLPALITEGAVVLVYDFEVRLQDYFRCLGFMPGSSDYNHRACFLGHEEAMGLRREKCVTRGVSFRASAEQLAHLLLSLRDFREWAAETFKTDDPYPALSQRLSHLCSNEHQLSARTFLTRYAFKK